MVLAALLFATAITIAAAAADESSSSSEQSYLNVYGDALQSCSYDGMALTGYTRSGYCVDQNDDSGSHHVCIDLSSLGGENGNENGNDDDQNYNSNNSNNNNSNNQNFCDVTGQSDWCSSEDFPCHEDPDTNGCPVTNWCVCQWAFASYIQGSGGCENIQTVVCESINQQALTAYQKMASQRNADNSKYETALACLVNRCGLEDSHLAMARTSATTSSFFGFMNTSIANNTNPTGRVGVAAILVGATALACYAYFHRKQVLASKTIRLNNNEPCDVRAIGENSNPTPTLISGESKLL
jgi:uncharacterized protein (DUF2237 family)